MHIYALVVVLIVVIIAITSARAREHEHAQFMTTTQTRNFLMRDNDQYIANFTPADMFARGFANTSDPVVYKQIVADTATDFSPTEKRYLATAIKQADQYISEHGSSVIGSRNAELLTSMDWVLAKTKGRIYENGMPHTRDNVIFLNDTIRFDDIVPILVHEKVHLFTRFYKKETQRLIYRYGFREVREVRGITDTTATTRANPDTDDRVYFHPAKGLIFSSQFYNPKPTHINHISSSPQNEHPYEWLAYLVGMSYK